uniref:Uncharacterized protein n=1 Tax=Helianthus annuus TaxID=4232 RepID=A0A251TYW3_HELAN
MKPNDRWGTKVVKFETNNIKTKINTPNTHLSVCLVRSKHRGRPSILHQTLTHTNFTTN